MTDRLTVKYHGEKVGTLSLTPDNRLCAFEYDREWLAEGYGRYLLHRALMREGIDDRKLTSIDRLSLVGNSGMGESERCGGNV